MSAPSTSQAPATGIAHQSAEIQPAATSPPQQLLKHLKEYPLFDAFEKEVESLPYPKRLVTAITPTLTAVRNTTPIKQVLDRGDLIADSALDEVDRYFPQLKKLEPHNITDPITKPISDATKNIEKAIDSVNKSIDNNVIKPVRKAVTDACNSIHSSVSSNVIDAHDMAVIDTSVTQHADEEVANSQPQEQAQPTTSTGSRFVNPFSRHSTRN